MPRRFEFVGGTSAKFWEISVAAATVTVCFGRIGTTGQVQTKRFAKNETATAHASKLINQKLAKGYQEVAGVGR